MPRASSSITVTGPRAATEFEPTPVILSEPSETSTRKRILLIDDDEQVLASVALVLEGEGYDALLADNGYEAVLQCRRHRPDLIVVDLNLPLRDGWTTLEAIEEVRPFLPMIIITGQSVQFDRAVAFGVDVLMEKPLDCAALLAAVEKLLAEPSYERLARITNQNFRTARLNSAGRKEP